jgi:prefoldin subunit 5
MKEIDARLKPVTDELDSINSQIKPLNDEMESLKQEHDSTTRLCATTTHW